MKWPWSRRRSAPRAEASSPFIDWIRGGPVDLAGIAVNETTAMGLSGFYRAGTLISSTLAALPLRSYTGPQDGARKRVPSIFDDPDGPDGQTPYEWKETLFLNLFVHGRAYALKVFNAAGGLARLAPLHPLCVTVQRPTPEQYRRGEIPVGGKWFWVRLDDGSTKRYDAGDVWEVPGASTDGYSPFSLMSLARASLSTAIAADKAAGKMFSKGALISGLATPEDELEPDEMPELRRTIDNAVGGYDNAGGIAVVNRRLKFTPWTMSAVDAQFLQQRQFQIEEISRWTGVPPHLLMQTEKQTSWGTGVEEQNRALGRTVLAPYGTRVEQRGSRLLASPRWIEFDFAGLERPSPDREIELLLAQTGKPFLTVNEARAIRNLPPVEGGDTLSTPAPAAPPAGGEDDEEPAEEEDDDAPPAE